MLYNNCTNFVDDTVIYLDIVIFNWLLSFILGRAVVDLLYCSVFNYFNTDTSIMEITTFTDYSNAAADTACYPKDRAIPYVMKGLIGETGEVNDKLKKVERGDYKLVGAKLEALSYELGDVAWYRARLCDELGSSLEENMFPYAFAGARKTIDVYNRILQDKEEYDFEKSLWGMNIALSNIMNTYGEKIMTDEPLDDVTKGVILGYLHTFGKFWTLVCLKLGLDPREVYQNNLIKLASRRERNVIKGDGDNR